LALIGNYANILLFEAFANSAKLHALSHFSLPSWFSRYVLGRVLVGALRLAAAKGIEPLKRFSFQGVYPLGCAATWAAVMYLWEGHPDLLPASLTKSMDAIYRRGDKWHGWRASAVPEAPFLAAAALAAIFSQRLPPPPST